MSSVSYRHLTGTAAENYQRDFVPADIARGTGHVARAAAERVGDTGTVTGIDIAPDMIEVAKSVPVPGSASVERQISDAAALSIPDALVDVALCQMGLMFMENRPAAVAEMRRVLEPSGRLAINTPGRIPTFFEALERALVEQISADLGGFVSAVFSMHDPDDVAGLLRGAGLRDVSSTVMTTTLRLPAPAEFLWQYIGLTPMAAFMVQAPRAARSALERQFVDEAKEHVVDGLSGRSADGRRDR